MVRSFLKIKSKNFEAKEVAKLQALDDLDEP